MTGISPKIKVLAIIGSTRKDSSNLRLIQAIAQWNTLLDLEIFNSIDDIPHFNPDLDHEEPPSSVSNFRNKIRKSKGVIISTPEYAMGVPGTLKNCIDWTVSSCEFSKKPVSLITASTSGFKGHQALLNTLEVIEDFMPPEIQLIIPSVKTKLKGVEITDAETREKVEKLLHHFQQLLV